MPAPAPVPTSPEPELTRLAVGRGSLYPEGHSTTLPALAASLTR